MMRIVRPKVSLIFPDISEEPPDLPGVHTRAGLVDEQQPRLGREGPGQLHPSLLPVGQAACHGASTLPER